MLGRKRILRVVAVLSVAFAAGELVETLRPTAAANRSSTALSVTGGYLVENAAPRGDALPQSASLVDGSGAGLPKVTAITPVAATVEGRQPNDCDVSLSLAPAAGAMIDLSLAAPCNRGERVVIRHSGLTFTALTSPEGQLQLQIPALEVDSLVAAYLEGAGIALAKVAVPEASAHVRFVVQMAFPAQFDLRAVEGGQVYVGSSGGATEGDRRRILPLGTVKVAQPLLAQVYTLPSDGQGVADLTAEIRITPETCGRTLQGDTILARGGNVTLSKIAVAVPLCGTSGDILLLKNLLHDLTLAAPR